LDPFYAKSCSVDSPVSKLILNTPSWFMKKYKASRDSKFKSLYKKYHCLVETEKVFGLSNQCSIVNRINLTIEKKFGTRVRYAYIGRLCQRLTDFYKFYENLTSPILFGVQFIKATIFVTKILVFLNPGQKPQGLNA
jgi:hypothetical protein